MENVGNARRQNGHELAVCELSGEAVRVPTQNRESWNERFAVLVFGSCPDIASRTGSARQVSGGMSRLFQTLPGQAKGERVFRHETELFEKAKKIEAVEGFCNLAVDNAGHQHATAFDGLTGH